jgi:hypothetical protein
MIGIAVAWMRSVLRLNVAIASWKARSAKSSRLLIHNLHLSVHDNIFVVLIEHSVTLQELLQGVNTFALYTIVSQHLVFLVKTLLVGKVCTCLEFTHFCCDIRQYEEFLVVYLLSQPVGSLIGKVGRIHFLVYYEVQWLSSLRHLTVVVCHVVLLGLQQTSLDTFLRKILDQWLVLRQCLVRTEECEEAFIKEFLILSFCTFVNLLLSLGEQFCSLLALYLIKFLNQWLILLKHLVVALWNRTRDDQWGTGVINQHRVDLIDDGVVVLALYQIGWVGSHVITKIIETELVVGTEGEFWDIYKLDVVEIPTNRPIQRKDLDDRVYKTAREKYRAVIDEIEETRNAGRPVLVGTTSVEISELLSKMLKMRNIPHNVLNAKLHQQEAQIVAEAGRSVNGKGAVTIATNMAGRGTDIKLTPEVKAAGGLAIIGTERHESRRVDRQLRGRAGRQGDPGSSVFYVSLEDKLMRLFASERIAKVMDRLGFEDGERIESPMISKSIERAQRKVEENNFGIRKHLLEYDDVMNRQRTVIYEKRRHALMGERIGMDIANIIWDRVLNIVNNNDFFGAKEEFLKVLAMEIPFNEDEYENGRREDLAERAFQEAMATFKRKTDRIQATAMPIIKQVYENQGAIYERIMVPITDGKRMYNIPCNLKEAYESEAKNVVKEFEKSVVLQIIDDDWKENLRKLDELKHSVQNASYEQKDPLLIFKLESAKVWDAMINDMYDRIASILMRGQIPVMEQEQPVQEAAPEQHTQQNYVESKVDLDAEREAQEAAARRSW